MTDKPTAPFPLRDAVAVVTGAASGIGAALAQALAARGCNLALADLNAAALTAVANRARGAGVRVSEHKLDVADKDAVAALPDAVLGEHGRVSVLVNNAGVALIGRFEQVSAEDFDWLFSINFWGVVNMTRAFLPALRRETAAQLVNLSSIYGIVAPPGETAYSASKFAVRGFSESLRHELVGTSIGVTVVHPGGVATSVAVNARRPAMSEAETKAMLGIAAKLLNMPPEKAAARILRGIVRREKRVLVGRDARQIAMLQRLFPVDYMPMLERAVRRKLRGGLRG